MRVWSLAFVLVCSIFCLSGCAHYQLGTAGKLTFSSLYIEPATNVTLLPQARATITTQIRQAFLQDGRVAVSSSPDASDAVLEIRIQDYHRDVASVLENDTGLARKFTVTLEVACTLRSKGSVLFESRIVRVQRDAFTDGGLLQSEYQTLPLLAEALAKKVTHTVLDVW